MQFTIFINQVKATEWGLSLQQAALFSFIHSAATWAHKEGDFWNVSKGKIITELPILTDKPDTILRLQNQLIEAGLIEKKVIKNNQYFKVTPLGLEWNLRVGEKSHPRVGKKSHLGSEKNPTQIGEKSHPRVGKKSDVLVLPSLSVNQSADHISLQQPEKQPGRKPAKSAAAWEAYCNAYRQRHKVEPVRNAKISRNLCDLVDRLGAEDAPLVAEFYVWHNGQHYVSRMHPVGLLLHDAESLHAQWQQGQQMTQTQARQIDKSQSNHSVIEGVIAKRNAKRGEV